MITGKLKKIMKNASRYSIYFFIAVHIIPKLGFPFYMRYGNDSNPKRSGKLAT
jgi:hypothetical protein